MKNDDLGTRVCVCGAGMGVGEKERKNRTIEKL